MTPEERREFDDMKRRLAELERVEGTAFIESLRRRLNVPQQLGDLTDVSSSAPSTGQVLKYDGNVWAPGTDNTA